jgi:flagellar biosynthesis protein FliQ
MILRRVIAHFRKQGWTAIAIDLVIVVVGVFIGLQVANWNAARQARADESAALRRAKRSSRGWR